MEYLSKNEDECSEKSFEFEDSSNSFYNASSSDSDSSESSDMDIFSGEFKFSTDSETSLSDTSYKETDSESSSGSSTSSGLSVQSQLLHSHLLAFRNRKVWVKPKSSEWYINVFPTLSDRDFKENFHVSKETYNFLITNLQGHLGKKDTSFRKSIPIGKRIAVALYHLASCGEYRVTANQFGIGKSTACSIVHEFTEAVNHNLKSRFIDFPNTVSKLEQAAKEFGDLHSLPQCVGAIDGCHIPVCPPKLHATDYYNYKGFYSIVLFAVVDARYKFTFINVGAPGRNNDAKLLRSSQDLWDILNSDLFDLVSKNTYGIMTPAYLLGDSDFPLMKHLLKPYPDHKTLNDVQHYYNHKVCGVRRVVENAFGRVKARFRIIYKRMEGKIDFLSRLVECCCTLNNICEYMNDEFQESWRNTASDVHIRNNYNSRVGDGSAKSLGDKFAKAMFDHRIE